MPDAATSTATLPQTYIISNNEKVLIRIINIAYALLFAIAGFAGNFVMNALAEHDKKFDALPTQFIYKDDYNRQHERLLDEFRLLSIKIDATASEIEADYNRRMDKLEQTMTELLTSGNHKP